MYIYPAFNENTVFFHKPYYIKMLELHQIKLLARDMAATDGNGV